MKIGIFGGSFNPIHIGHLKIILNAILILQLDKIIVIPVGNPSHKDGLENDEDRFIMCKLSLVSEEARDILESLGVIEDKDKILEKIEVSKIEIENNEISYTYDTLIELKKRYPFSEFYEIIGEDSANNIKSWKNYEGIFKESQVVVFNRKGTNYKNNEIEDSIYSRIKILNTPYYPFSSSEIRERIKNGESLEGMLSQNVGDYIIKNKLYKQK